MRGQFFAFPTLTVWQPTDGEVTSAAPAMESLGRGEKENATLAVMAELTTDRCPKL